MFIAIHGWQVSGTSGKSQEPCLESFELSAKEERKHCLSGSGRADSHPTLIELWLPGPVIVLICIHGGQGKVFSLPLVPLTQGLICVLIHENLIPDCKYEVGGIRDSTL